MRLSTIILAGVSASGAAMAQVPDGPFAGAVTETAPQAEYTLTLEAGQVVTLSTASIENFDTVLALIGPDGKPVAQNDDCDGSLQSCITFMPPDSGRYTARVTGYGEATGAFELTVAEGANVGLSYAAETLREEVVTLGSGTSEVRAEIDLDADAIFVASTYALTETLDTTLTLLDADGNILAQNDDRGDGSLNAQIVYQPDQAGHFTVLAGSYDGQGQGDLVLSLALDPNAQVPFDFASVEGETIAEHTGMLGADNREQSYPVELTAGQTVMIVADAMTDDLDTVLTLNGPDGFPVAMNDDRGDGTLNSAIAYTAAHSGTYTLEISRYHGSDTSGEFRIVLSAVDASVVDTLQALNENVVTLSGPELTLETEDFIVHYTLEGGDASSARYAELVGIALQESYEAQIGRMGWAEPLRDDNGRYRAYVAHVDGAMGFTKPVETVFDNPNTPDVRETLAARTAFVIDNDFLGLGKEAPAESLLRATATHEFNHVVQFGYDAEEGLDWLYEATASWIEVATMGSDQDATDYVGTDFDTPHLCWTTQVDGHDYAQWTLLQSMADSHGEAVVRRLWESSVTLDGFETASATLAEYGSDIPATIQRWRAQNYARAYDLAPLFSGSVAVRHTLDEPGRWMSKGGLEELGADYLVVDLDGRFQVSLEGEDGLELIGLGRRGDEVVAIALGQTGVFDTSGFSDAALMVFNSTLPAEPGTCNGVGYSIEIEASTGRMAAPAYRFDAPHFLQPGVSEAADSDEAAAP
ncbi:pre-peptidase C-terminal domain-containing protein [Maricaulis virginensis]|uniref:Peptidase C-terminal archaeal/bacterial domain-containing protein n=1 Tax=Maricaulis virginensis TaxID=144022 RepID=A0A9W6IP35_9PROT|nr:pre-peptidase C-terminal domain-containing protein [Maricaulis virginensis]GLK53912.1 hypothetical protein GCM10017621_34200 [Maricaulis virginensis]